MEVKQIQDQDGDLFCRDQFEIDDAQSECNLCGCTFLDNDELEYRIEDAHRRMKNNRSKN